MLEGKKPLAMFYAEISELPNEDLIPEEAFGVHVASGRFVRGETTVEAAYHPKLERNVLVRYVFFALKDEAWRINAIRLLLKESAKSGWNETCERMEGSLLGYTDKENDAHCRGRFQADAA
jgi:hypothetical protein